MTALDDEGKTGPDLAHTLRFMRCNTCGNIFVANISGYSECPECFSTDAMHFRPDETPGQS